MFLTIGISSIRRKNNDEYLQATLENLLENLSNSDLNDVTIVVFLADSNATYCQEVLLKLKTKHGKLLEKGVMNIIQAKPEYYPNMANLKQNYGDSLNQVKWRSKQAADFALLFSFVAGMAEYHLQLEDDVKSSPDFVLKIKDGIKKHAKTMWAVLTFTNYSTSFIGHLFKSVDLHKFSKYLLIFFDEQPVDWLLVWFINGMGQKKLINVKPPLFEHVGKISSLEDANVRNEKLTRQKKAKIKSCIKTDNPLAANITTNMNTYGKNSFQNLYSCKGGEFWVSNVGQNLSLTIILQNIELVHMIAIKTGSASQPSDFIQNGSIQIGENQNCRNLTEVGKFSSGLFKEKFSPPKRVACVGLQIRQQENWVKFTNFEINTH